MAALVQDKYGLQQRFNTGLRRLLSGRRWAKRVIIYMWGFKANRARAHTRAAQTQTQTQTQTHTHTHTHAHADTDTHIHTRAHAEPQSHSNNYTQRARRPKECSNVPIS